MSYQTGLPGVPGVKSDGQGGLVVEGGVRDADGNPIGGASYPGVTSVPPGISMDGRIGTDNENIASDGAGTLTLKNAISHGTVETRTLRSAQSAHTGLLNGLTDTNNATLPLTSPDAPTFNSYQVAFPVGTPNAPLQNVQLFLKSGVGLSGAQTEKAKLYVSVVGQHVDGTPDTSARINCGVSMTPSVLSTSAYQVVNFPLQVIADPADYPNGMMIALDVETDDQDSVAAQSVFILAGSSHSLVTPYAVLHGDGVYTVAPDIAPAYTLESIGPLLVDATTIRSRGPIGVHGKTPPDDAASITGNITTGNLAALQASYAQLLAALDDLGYVVNSTT